MREDEKQMSAVIRTISILEALSKTDRINLENLAKETELPKATLLRFLSTLTSLGYVFRDGADMYHLTMKMFAVGSRSLKHIDLISTAIPFAKELSNDLGETVHMGILEDCNAVYVLKEESKYTLRMYSRVGKVIPLYCTAIGKVFLSEMSEDDKECYFRKTPLKPFTAKSIRTIAELKTELDEIKKRGWSIDDEEHEENDADGLSMTKNMRKMLSASPALSGIMKGKLSPQSLSHGQHSDSKEKTSRNMLIESKLQH